VCLAVDRAAGRAVDEAPYARSACGLEHVDRPDHVDARVGRGVGHGLAHVDLRAEMEDHLRLRLLDDVAHGGPIAEVGLDQPGAARLRALQVVTLTGGEVVDHGHLVRALEQRIHDVGANEAGAACNESPHGARIVAVRRPTRW
jgi:hypothetical protein